MEATVVFAGLAFAINKSVSVVKALFNRDVNGVVSQVLVWVIGFGGLALAARSSLTGNYMLPGFQEALKDLDTGSLMLLAWILGSSGSFVYDFKKAIDNGDSAKEDRLIGG